MKKAVLTADDIETELKKALPCSVFSSPEISRRFELETKVARIRNIRLAVGVGLPAYLLVCLFDAPVIPDLGRGPALFRLLLVASVGAFMWRVLCFKALFREAFTAVAATVAMAGPVAFIAASRAPLAPYMMLVVVVVGFYANVTLRLRFLYACAFNAASLLAVGAMVLYRHDLPGVLSGVIAVSWTTSAVFGLVANFEIERAEGKAFLMGLKESLRSECLEQEREHLSHLSLLDPLTSLPNRRCFDAAIASLFEARRTSGREFSLLMIDVDYFKLFNDHHGHVEGDRCLQAVAQVLQQLVLHAGDTFARLGGEEFAVLLADDGARGTATGEQLQRFLAEAGIPHAGRRDGRKTVTVSVGIATSVLIATPTDMLMVADRRLYAAKQAGRDIICADERRSPQRLPEVAA